MKIIKAEAVEKGIIDMSYYWFNKSYNIPKWEYIKDDAIIFELPSGYYIKGKDIKEINISK